MKCLDSESGVSEVTSTDVHDHTDNVKILANYRIADNNPESHELRRIIDGIPMVLRFSSIPNQQAIANVREIMLKSLGNMVFSFGDDAL